jgi:hypothetical protein
MTVLRRRGAVTPLDPHETTRTQVIRRKPGPQSELHDHAGGHVVWVDTAIDPLTCTGERSASVCLFCRDFLSGFADTVLPVCCPK